MQTRILTFVLALAFAVAAFLPLYFIVVLPIAPIRVEAELLFVLTLLAVSVYVLRRSGGWPAALFVSGSVGLLVACLYAAFLDYGLRYDWFQFGGEGAFVLQGYFEPRQNPILKIPAYIAGYAGELITPVGIFCCAARWIHKHLTRRCSEPLAGPRSSFR